MTGSAGHGRALTEIAAGLSLIGLSILIFGWAALGWWEPDDEQAVSKDMNSLVFYSNDAAVPVTINLHLRMDEDRKVSGSLGLEIGRPRDSRTFRWALVGRGDLTFDHLHEDEVHEASKPGSFSKHCNEDRSAGAYETILAGDLSGGHFVGAEQPRIAEPQDLASREGATILADLNFPHMRALRSGEQYTLSIGGIGKPGDEMKTQMANYTIAWLADCVNIDDAEPAFNGKNLDAHQAHWTVRVFPVSEEDELQLADPDPINRDSAAWAIDGFAGPTASFSDHALKEFHQMAVFIAGIVVGVGTTYLVQGLTNLTK